MDGESEESGAAKQGKSVNTQWVAKKLGEAISFVHTHLHICNHTYCNSAKDLSALQSADRPADALQNSVL